MGVPSFNPDTFLSELASFNYSVDPSKDASGVTLTLTELQQNPAFQGLESEWATGTTNGAGGTAGGSTNSAFEGGFNQWLSVIDAADTNPGTRLPFPSSWSSFITSFRNYFGIADNSSLGISSTNLNSGPAFNGFLQQFEQTLQTSTDWASLGTTEVQDQFVNTFSGFLANYPFTPSTDSAGNVTYPPETTQTFLNNYLHFTTVTAVNENATQATAGYGSLLNYQQAYQAFFPNATQQDFDTELASFVNEVTSDSASGGYFNPSQNFSRFFSEIKNKYLVLQASQGTIQANKGVQLAVLWSVYSLIVSLTQSIQTVTAISAQRLGYLTNLQRSYTDLINTIPTFLNGTPFSTDDTGTINAQNQAYAQNLRSYSDLVGSASKSLQSNISSLNDSTNSTANLLTSIIQEMTTLISSIAK